MAKVGGLAGWVSWSTWPAGVLHMRVLPLMPPPECGDGGSSRVLEIGIWGAGGGLVLAVGVGRPAWGVFWSAWPVGGDGVSGLVLGWGMLSMAKG